MATTYLTRTFSSPTNRKIWTWSAWVKRQNQVSNFANALFGAYYNDNNRSVIRFNAHQLNFQDSANSVEIKTNRLFRDMNAWYHIVVRVDTTQGTASNRVRMYVNGVQETSFGTSAYPAQNDNMQFNGADPHYINARNSSGVNSIADMSYSHIHFADGQSLAPTVFGETDATTGEWKIKVDPSFTLGNNGFTILKDGNTITDQSSNSNNFTVGAGTLTKTEDNPSNVFCTWNPNYRSARKDMTLTNGNTFIFEQNSGDSGVSGTIAVSSGKWYWEQKIAQVNGTNAAITGGLHTVEDFSESPTDAMAANTVGMRSNGNVWKGTTDLGNFTAATYNNDIIGVGFDADNGSMYFWRNGTALNSGNAIITGMDMTKTWVPFGVQHGGARVTTSTNFGNGYFQTTAVSSAGTNASNNGIFEYDVPSGYTALSTKGLNL
tara:strand:+ start:379 stop:1680 length:1302 start_codon:yes stop_codon:yes gene_type:complete